MRQFSKTFAAVLLLLVLQDEACQPDNWLNFSTPPNGPGSTTRQMASLASTGTCSAVLHMTSYFMMTVLYCPHLVTPLGPGLHLKAKKRRLREHSIIIG
jgi:hypothetical protein